MKSISRRKFPASGNTGIRIELFYAPGCPHCASAWDRLNAWIDPMDDRIAVFEINVLDALDRAVELGIRRTPTIALNGEPVFTGLPSESDFLVELHRRLS